MGEALPSSALQPEDPQQGSDSSSLMQMNHAVKTTPKQRRNLGFAASRCSALTAVLLTYPENPPRQRWA